MMRRCLLAAALMQAAAELLCERTGACTRDREEENSILLHTRLHKVGLWLRSPRKSYEAAL